MKPILFALFIALLMVGCGESAKPPEGVVMTDPAPKKDAIETAVDWSKLQDRSGVTYLPNTDKPFSGYAKRAYENEQIEALAQFKDGYVVRFKIWEENGTPRRDLGFIEGKVAESDVPFEYWSDSNSSHYDGLYSVWYSNGQKLCEGNFKNGMQDGLWTFWNANGQKKSLSNWKDGKEDGLRADWYENGKKKEEMNYKEGKIMSAEVWKLTGEKCSVTNYKDGNGVVVWYKDDGTERGRLTYKDGELVID